jgi:hypothetical protein
VHVEHSVGMLHLAVLLANPGTEIPAIELVAGVTALAHAARGTTTQPVLDTATVRRYRQRLAELGEPDGDRDGDRRRDERGWLLAELAANTRPGGRARAFADDAERARLAVSRAIRRAVGHLDHADPAIGSHLRGAVHTGIRCWYRPS